MELHEKVFVDPDFLDTEHGQLGCTACHGGNAQNPDWQTAHQGVIKDPSYPDPTKACGGCHEEICAENRASLHITLAPYNRTILARMDTTSHETMSTVTSAMETHCMNCHSSCGQCHVSRPHSVDGGFVEGHLFQKKPPMATNCTSCHGSRLEKEYTGKNEGFTADVHYGKRYMKCIACHKGSEMHGVNGQAPSRYQAANIPACIDCHADAISEKPKTEIHRTHVAKLECHVCHSVSYKNCYGCHVGKNGQGLPYYQVDRSEMDFKIGKNPNPTEKRPYKYVLLRHVPTNPNLFDYYVKGAMKNFDTLPTWKFATPHNIQRITPQTKRCNACHGNTKLFLLEKDVPPSELKANQVVILKEDEIPPKR